LRHGDSPIDHADSELVDWLISPHALVEISAVIRTELEVYGVLVLDVHSLRLPAPGCLSSEEVVERSGFSFIAGRRGSASFIDIHLLVIADDDNRYPRSRLFGVPSDWPGNAPRTQYPMLAD
jgi:hypothetical protein